jgi:EmrB/QacA subfamily drug resistance transporter
MSESETSNGAATAAVAPDKLDPALIKISLVTVVGAFAALMDATIVGVGIDALRDSFDTSLSTIQWVLTGYLLALVVAIPLVGWGMERFGARTMWLASIGLFMVTSVLAGSAWSIGSLIAFRVLQGFAGGMILPIAMATVVQAAGPNRLGRVMSIVGVPAQLAPVLGPVLGGVIIEQLSWRWMFFINVPICLFAIVGALAYMPASQGRPAKKLDILGLLLLSPGVAALVYGLSYAALHGFGQPTALVWLVVGVALLAAYTAHSLRPGVRAIVDLRLFRVRSFSTASLVNFLFGVSLFAAMFLLPLYYIQARGHSAQEAGLLLAPQGLGLLLAFLVVGRLTDRMNPRPIILVGMAIATVGTLPFAFVGNGVNDAVLGVALLIRGMGLGAATIPLNAAAYQGLSRQDIPQATSAINIINRLGGTFGTAILAVVLQYQIATHAPGVASQANAFGTTFVWTLVLTALALVPALLIPARPIAPQATAPSPAPVTETPRQPAN